MSRIKISELSLYSWRYFIGYGAVAIGLIFVLFFAGMYSPGGLSSQEMQSAVISNSISFNGLEPSTVANLPYYVLQKISMNLFGISIISIKLPSIILAFLSAIGMFVLLAKWFKLRIAVLASLIAITTGQFIFIAQNGTPGILYLFWSVLLILLASLISSSNKKYRMLYKISFSIIAALSLYTPLSIYVLIAMFSAVILHPHLRFIIRQLSKPKIIISLIVSFILLIPLILSTIKNPNILIEMLGIPSKLPDFGASLSKLGAEYLGFANPGGSTLMTPFFELGSTLIILIGTYYTIKTNETAKSYVISLWIVCLIPVLLINPNITDITYLPLILLLASGLKLLISHWYSLFPLNPYARIAGLIPVVILVVALVSSGIDRYIYGYRYDPNISSNFSNDISLIPKDTKQIVVADSEINFYKVIESHNKNINVVMAPTENTFISTRLAKQSLSDYSITNIITSSRSSDSDRFYLYKKITK